jgi:hypothetical protein
MLSANDEKIQRLLTVWYENMIKVGNLKDSHPSTKEHYKTVAKDRTKFIALDYGGSGHFLVDRKTEQVYSIKGYGVPNLKKPRGTVEFLTQFIGNLTTEGKEYMHTYWYALHPTEY